MTQTLDLTPTIDERGHLLYVAGPRQPGRFRSSIPGLLVTAALAALLAVLNRFLPRE